MPKGVRVETVVPKNPNPLPSISAFRGVPGCTCLNAAPSLTVGTPGNIIDSLTADSKFGASTYAAQGVTISSPEGLLVEPYSTQSGPNELFDNSAAGPADISIKTFGTWFWIDLYSCHSGGRKQSRRRHFVISDTTYDIFGVQILESKSSTSYSGLAIDDLQVAPTPEPAAIALFGIGALVLGASRFRRRA